MIRTALTILSLLTFSYAGGFQGTITSSLGDQVAGAHILGKHGNTVVVDTFANDAGEYLLNWSTVGIAGGIDFKLPSTKLTALGNSITSDGRVYPFLDGSPDNVAYRVYDLSGREVTDSPVYAQGKYFLQVFNQASGKILGVKPFVYLDGNGLDVQFKVDIRSPNSLAKAMEDTDSLIVEYTGSGMLLERYAEAVVVPESFETRDIVLTRTLQNIVIEFSNIPANPTIDTTYVIIINAVSPDYDNHITDLDVFHLSGDSINYEFNGIDSLVISPHTQGDHEFYVLANDENSHRSRTIELGVESQIYSVALKILFNGLGLPRADIDVSLRNKIIRTGTDGLATFEFPTSSVLTETDSIDLDDNVLGNLQDGAGPFAAMRFGLFQELVDTDDAHTIQTFTDEMMRQDANYWDDYVWANQLDREFYLTSLFALPDGRPFIFAKRGSIENGFTDLFHYSPEFTNVNSADYRAATDVIIDSIRTAIEDLANDEELNGNVPITFINVALEDSMQAIEHGNTFDFSRSNSAMKYMNLEQDTETGQWYVTTTGQYINRNLAPGNALEKDIGHELGRAVKYVNLTPYSPDAVEDVMGSGDVQPHDMAGYYFMLNADPKLFLKIRNIRSVVPASEPYWPTN